jgi:signal transduction histidine kinase
VLEVEIVDDGCGIAPNCHRGVGLSAMQERAGELGGDCVVDTPPAGGTRVTARLPCGRP